MVFGTRFILRLIRRVTEGVSPELEIGQFLTDSGRFPYMAPWPAPWNTGGRGSEPERWGSCSASSPTRATPGATPWTRSGIISSRPWPTGPGGPNSPWRPRVRRSSPPRRAAELANALIGTYLENADLLGRRTAELHLALASDREDPAFAPEPFTSLYQRSLYQSMRNQTARSHSSCCGNRPDVIPDVWPRMQSA